MLAVIEVQENGFQLMEILNLIFSAYTMYSYIPQIVTKFLAIFPQKVTICGNLTNFYEIVILTRKVTFLIPFENYSTFSVTEHILSHTL